MDGDLIRLLFVGGVIVAGGAAFAFISQATLQGRRITGALGILAASPLVMFTVWWAIQKGQPSLSGLSLAHASWSALSDFVVIPTAVAMAANGWRHMDYYRYEISEFWLSREWLILSYLIGFWIGLGLHLMGGHADSHSAVLSERLHDSATSWAHNLGVVPALAGTLIATIIPLFTTYAARKWAWLATACVAIWLGLAIADSVRAGLDPSNPLYFDPHWLDVVMDWRYFRPV